MIVHSTFSKVQGIHLLGGFDNGLNFEIEYEDLLGNYKEAVWSVRLDLAEKEISEAYATKTGLNFRLGGHKQEVQLPGGLFVLHEVRRPTCIGGGNVKNLFRQ